MKKMVLLGVLAMMLVGSGCATSTTAMRVEHVTVAGKDVTYVFGESRDHTGIHQKVVDRYDENGMLLESSTASGEGIVQKIIPAIISGGAMAGGLIGAASVMPADTTTVSQASTSALTTTNANSQASSMMAPTTVDVKSTLIAPTTPQVMKPHVVLPPAVGTPTLPPTTPSPCKK